MWQLRASAAYYWYQLLPRVLYLGLIQLTAINGQLRFTSVQMPALVERGSNFWLSCQYQSAPSDPLYSVKWYKNNEEFYRLMINPSTLSSHSSPVLQQDQSAASLWQQHYFTQSGVNVLMSSSNATHVRLLNASLASEGLYACEISTQNLSTIRSERELRIFVLPQSKLTIIGLRERYALGESLELVCLSDFGRPQPALAWFINGRRIDASASMLHAPSVEQHEPEVASWFELEQRTKSKLDEPSLLRVSLALKFKLSQKLLTELVAVSSTGSGRTPSARNQSQHQQQQQEIRLQCKLALTEVSDVTYNELVVRRRLAAHRRAPSATATRRRADWAVAADSTQVGVSKVAGNRVEQRPSLADRWSLQRLLATSMGPDQCTRPHALLPDDPLMVEPEEEADTPSSLAGGHPVEAEVGEVVSVNCSTIGALMEPTRQLEMRQCEHTLLARHRTTAALHHQHQHQQQQQQQQHQLAAHKRHQPIRSSPPSSSGWGPNELRAPNQRLNRPQQSDNGNNNNNNNNNNNINVAYLSLTSGTNADSSDNTLVSNQWHRASAAQSAPKVTTMLTGTTAPTTTSGKEPNLAPPLLEWFINNQEAPKASVNYQPYPVPTTSLSATTIDTVSQNSLELPSIDYGEYFANFVDRPMQQYLPLRLRLEKVHFETSDSLLRLRCSSTQAQPLTSDTASVSIIALAADMIPATHLTNGGKHTGWTRANQRQPVMAQKRPHTRSSNGAALNLTRSPASCCLLYLSLIMMPFWLMRLFSCDFSSK